MDPVDAALAAAAQVDDLESSRRTEAGLELLRQEPPPGAEPLAASAFMTPSNVAAGILSRGSSVTLGGPDAGVLRLAACRQWAVTRRHRVATAEEVALKEKLRRHCSGGRRAVLATHGAAQHVDHRRVTLGDLPNGVRLAIFQYVPVLERSTLEDMRDVLDILAMDDSATLVAPHRAGAVFSAIGAALEEHKATFARSATVGRCMGITDDTDPDAVAVAAIVAHAQAERTAQAVAAVEAQRQRDHEAADEFLRARCPDSPYVAKRRVEEPALRPATASLLAVVDLTPSDSDTGDAAPVSSELAHRRKFTAGRDGAMLTQEEAVAWREVAADRRAGLRLPHLRLPHPQRAELDDALRRAVRQLRFLQERLARVQEWCAFRDGVFGTPCCQLRDTLRRDLAWWGATLESWHERAPDISTTQALADHALLHRRIRGLEYLGDPALTLDDARNLFWEVDLRVPEGVTDSYLTSLTFAQALRLGLLAIPWVAGYTWEDRDAGQDAAVRAELGSVASGKLDTRTGEERAADDAALAAQEADRRAVAEAREQARHEAEREEARAVAVEGMASRLWMSTLPPRRPRTEHRFGGCSVCGDALIHMVGLKTGSGVDSNVVLCRRCYDEEYAPHAVLLKPYQWHLVSDLVHSTAALEISKATAMEAEPSDVGAAKADVHE